MMKKMLSVFLTAVFILSSFAVTASAAKPAGGQTVYANFYLLKEGLAVPVGTASQPTQNYTLAGKGKIKITWNTMNGYYDAEGVDDYIVSAPKIELQAGQSVIWYVIKKEKDIWHVDGVITPFCSVLYDANCDQAAGATTDTNHYYKGESAKVQENGFVRDGYEFIGWNTAADGSGKNYAAGDVMTSDQLVFDQSINTVTLFAQWKSIPQKPEPVEPAGEVVSVRVDAARKMAVRFEDGSIYYDGETKAVEVGKEYRFQMCAVNWDNGIYDDNGNGLAGSVVYTFKAVHKDTFDALRAEAVKNPERYTVKGIDIIDNEAKTITVNCDVSDFHLETDVNNFFVAYRFHFAKGDYNKQTGIERVVNKPLESLSVNLPVGTTIRCDAYHAYEKTATENIFVTGNNGEGMYADAYWASVNDYTWNG